MRTLAIETATEACSIALFEETTLIAHDHREIGRGHAERLVPMIAELPEKGRADRILVSLGPGSFTGVRIGIATARALGFAWGCDVIGYPTLALVATIARAQAGIPPNAKEVTVCMNGGHGEWFVQDFDASGMPESGAASLAPEAAAHQGSYTCIAGNRASELAQAQGDELFQPHETLPDARFARLLPEALLTSDLSPIYGRAPDAKPQVTPEQVAP
ncbi:MAG: tRNA (adenosine(37)-N6)-threonylcarbamoyltransferase complex dimerization subunit type 1 TsaB [Pseudomonadota bacterium]